MGQAKYMFMEERERVNEEEIYFGNKTLFSTTIPNFTNTILVANKIRIKPYLKGHISPKIPNKYKTPDYDYNNAGKLANVRTGEICVSNPTKAGTARLWVVNFNDVYSGKVKDQALGVYMDKIKAYLMPYFTEQPMIYEKGLTCQIHFYVLDKGARNIDDDNMSLWMKATCDVMKKTILSEDDPKILCGHNTKTIFVTDEYQTKMVVSLIK